MSEQRGKRRAGSVWAWAALAVVAVVALAVGVDRSRGARTPAERIDAIARTVKCPVCPGESLYESRNSVALNMKNEIARQVRAGQTDGEIRAELFARFPGTALVPAASGLDSVVWVLPVAVLVLSAAGLVVAFRRWRRESTGAGGPTNEDQELVEAALAAERRAPGGPSP
jgi:cytochrome c-type biogenesis protein CcmH